MCENATHVPSEKVLGLTGIAQACPRPFTPSACSVRHRQLASQEGLGAAEVWTRLVLGAPVAHLRLVRGGLRHEGERTSATAPKGRQIWVHQPCLRYCGRFALGS